MNAPDLIVDLYGGPGGWEVALDALGHRAIGLEHDAAACATRAAVGFATIRADIAHYPTGPFRGRVRGLIASPPCPAFSAAGKGEGRELLPEILDAVHRRDWAWRGHPDPEVWLVVDLGRWIVDLAPEWIALEQVPAVAPVWRAYAHLLDELGYSTWTGLLNAANYGVPQTRTRAILTASRARAASPPPPTHAQDPEPSLFDPLDRWVTMADALGWGMTARPGLTFTGASSDTGGPRRDGLGGSGAREILRIERDEGRWTLNTGRDWKPGGTRVDAQTLDMAAGPAPALTAKSGGQWHLNRGQSHHGIHDPAEVGPTLTSQTRSWGWTRPATTVACDPRSWPPGHKVNGDDIARLGDLEARERYGDRAGTEAIRLTIGDALALQSFPPGYPVAGTMTKQFEQIGNAIPPRLAWHILRTIVT